uniref:Uncharacterized protein n=1 Tax=viral metagenome TaxID=1070528 RepID=A0A6C0CF21_9ZZZZ
MVIDNLYIILVVGSEAAKQRSSTASALGFAKDRT